MSAALSKLRTLERAAYKFFKQLEATAKVEPALQSEVEPARDRWIKLHNLWETRNILAAARRDKNVELYTVFIPDRHSVTEVRRTSDRRITTHAWKRDWPYPHYDAHTGSRTEVLKPRLYQAEEPYRDFSRLMKQVAA